MLLSYFGKAGVLRWVRMPRELAELGLTFGLWGSFAKSERSERPLVGVFWNLLCVEDFIVQRSTEDNMLEIMFSQASGCRQA